MNAWGQGYGSGGAQDTIFKKTSDYDEHFKLLMKWEYYKVKVMLDFSDRRRHRTRGKSESYGVEISKIIYFNGDIIKAATIDTPYGDMPDSRVLKWDKKSIYYGGVKNKDKRPVPDDLPFQL